MVFSSTTIGLEISIHVNPLKVQPYVCALVDSCQTTAIDLSYNKLMVVTVKGYAQIKK